MALQPPPKHLARQRRHDAKMVEREQTRRDERHDRADAAARKQETERRRRKDTDSSATTGTITAVFTISIPKGTSNATTLGSDW